MPLRLKSIKKFVSKKRLSVEEKRASIAKKQQEIKSDSIVDDVPTGNKEVALGEESTVETDKTENGSMTVTDTLDSEKVSQNKLAPRSQLTSLQEEVKETEKKEEKQEKEEKEEESVISQRLSEEEVQDDPPLREEDEDSKSVEDENIPQPEQIPPPSPKSESSPSSPPQPTAPQEDLTRDELSFSSSISEHDMERKSSTISKEDRQRDKEEFMKVEKESAEHTGLFCGCF